MNTNIFYFSVIDVMNYTCYWCKVAQILLIRYCYVLAICILLCASATAQLATSASNQVATFTPAPFTRFAFDFSVGLPVIELENNFTQLPGTIVRMPDGTTVLRLQSGYDNKLIPDITTPPVTTHRYITFECEYSATNHDSSSLLLSFPDARGYKHTIEFSSKWITTLWQGVGFSDNKYNTTYRNAYRYLTYKPTEWHCIGVEISDAYLKIFIDGHEAWGLGKYGENGVRNVYDGSQFNPLTFNISSKGSVSIRSVRLATSNTKPGTNMTQKDNFNTTTSPSLSSYTINFETGSTEIYPHSYAVLQQLTAYMRLHQHVKLLVAGHTDNMGESDNNQELSERRADAVIEWLRNAGIAPDRLITKGYAASMPLLNNDTEAGRAANRRVELKIQ